MVSLSNHGRSFLPKIAAPALKTVREETETPPIALIPVSPGQAILRCAELLLALPERHEFAPRRPLEELARTPDLVLGIADHLVPLRDPADRAGEREERREHADRNAERLVDDAGIEIDVRIELALDEVFVLERDLLELQREPEETVVLQVELLQHLVADTLNDLRARIVVLVHPVAEAEQHRVIVAILHALDVLADVVGVANALQHV